MHSSIKKYHSKSSNLVNKNIIMFEHLGIDVMFDTSHKMWLLECNDSPGMNETTTKDENGRNKASGVKYNKNIYKFLEGTLSILGFDNTEKKRTSGFWMFLLSQFVLVKLEFRYQ